MNVERNDPDDPRLTAYALGELQADERREMERLLDGSPEARAAVDEILEAAGSLYEALNPATAEAVAVGQAATRAGQQTRESGVIPAARAENGSASRIWPTGRRLGLFGAVAVNATVVAAVVVFLWLPGTRDPFMRPADRSDRNRPADDNRQYVVAARRSEGGPAQLRYQPARAAERPPSESETGSYADTVLDVPRVAKTAANRQTSRSVDSEPGPAGPVSASKLARQRAAGANFDFSDAATPGKPANGQIASPGSGGEVRVPANPPIVRAGAPPADAARERTLTSTPAKRRRGDPSDARSLGRGTLHTQPKGVGAPDTSLSAAEPANSSAAPPSSVPASQPESLEQSLEAQSRSRARESTLTANQIAQPHAADDVALGLMLQQKGRAKTVVRGGQQPSQSLAYPTQFRLQDLSETDAARLPAPGFTIARRDDSYSTIVGSRLHIAMSDGESYAPLVENKFLSPTKEPLSTFSTDVDTAAYSNVRRYLNAGKLPPPGAVRIEELINYFAYESPPAPDGEPFAVALEAGPCPWNDDHRLVRIGLKGRNIPQTKRPPSNLVFLVDVSGSMRDYNKLPLVKTGLEMLVEEMTEDDRIAIVTYANGAGMALEPTSGEHRDVIRSVINSLHAGGSTNGEAGIRLAYQQAVANRTPEGNNRVILCTDGDFNVGVTDDDELVRLIREHAVDNNVFLSVFGFGIGNLQDARLERLADDGNGHYGYVDGYREARKVFVEEMAGTLHTIAKDVKMQIEFNPARVGAYRLIGYENRVMPDHHFNDDRKDAGDIGAGHSLTALYEIISVESMPEAKLDELKYQQPRDEPDEPAGEVHREELLTFKLRFKLPEAETSTRLDFPLAVDGQEQASASPDLAWASAVAAFGMLLRDSQYKGQANFDMVRELAHAARGGDPSGRRLEFIDHVRTAEALSSR